MKDNKLIPVQMYQPGYGDNSAQYAWSIFPGNNSPLKLIWPLQNATLQNLASEGEIAAMVADVQEKERKLIGQELHDNVNQILCTVKVFIEMLHPADARDTGLRKKTVEYITMAIEEIRKISWELVMPRQKEEGLVDSIKQIIDDIHFSTQIRIVFEFNRNIECLSQDKKITLLRIVQEQLNNVVKYSQASLVNIDLHSRNDGASLIIKDNGVGFNPEQKRQGIGISNIYERVQSHNGSVNLQAAKGCGCTLSISLPD